MNKEFLGKELKEMYENAKDGEKATMIHLFGIKYANEILRSENSIAEIVNISGLPDSYIVEVNKGKKLAKYVSIK
jgi:5-methylcytosine-specific restriction protein B